MTLPASVRLGAAGAAAVLAGLSQGEVLVLAAVLALAVWRPLPSVGVTLALLAAAWRWGSAALVDLAGAQAVLGPAGTVEPPVLAASAWWGAVALVAAAPRPAVGPDRSPDGRGGALVAWGAREAWSVASAVAAALGLAAAVVVAGPAPGGALWARVLAAVAATAVAVAVGRFRASGHGQLLDLASVGAGLLALALVAVEGRPWEGALDGGAALEGAVIAVAVGVAVGVVALAIGAMEQRRT